jgi:hypothetical protein
LILHGRTTSIQRDISASFQALPATGIVSRSVLHSFAATRHELKQLSPQQRA